MSKIITLGETMGVFTPSQFGPLRYIHDYKLRIAGAESNTAIGAAKLGIDTVFITRVGADELGDFVINSIRAEGVDCSHIKKDATFSTGMMIKQIESQGTKVFYYRANSAASHMSPKDVKEELFERNDILHVTGITPVLSDSCRETIYYAMDLARSKGLRISFDPNIRKKLWRDKDFTPMIRDMLMKSDIVLAGAQELEVLLGENTLEGYASIILENNPEAVIGIKLGGEGTFIADKDMMKKLEPHKCTVVDSVGAGDAYNSAFLAGIIMGEPLEKCGIMGKISGALATQTTGDIEGLPSKQELDSIIENRGIVYR